MRPARVVRREAGPQLSALGVRYHGGSRVTSPRTGLYDHAGIGAYVEQPVGLLGAAAIGRDDQDRRAVVEVEEWRRCESAGATAASREQEHGADRAAMPDAAIGHPIEADVEAVEGSADEPVEGDGWSHAWSSLGPGPTAPTSLAHRSLSRRGDVTTRSYGDGVEFEFSGTVWHWRGPSPFHFVTVPEDESAHLHAIAPMVTYGWGMIPVVVRIGSTTSTTSLFPKDGGYVVPLKNALRAAEQIDVGDVVRVSLSVDA